MSPDKDIAMLHFQCQNSDCAKQSHVRDISWYNGQHVVECVHCRQWHELRQLDSADGAPIQFEVVGLLDL